MTEKTKNITSRTSKGLRETLFKELDDLRAGESTPSRAKAVSSLAGQISSSVAMEIAMAKFVTSDGNKPVVETRKLPEIEL